MGIHTEQAHESTENALSGIATKIKQPQTLARNNPKAYIFVVYECIGRLIFMDLFSPAHKHIPLTGIIKHNRHTWLQALIIV